MSIENRLDIFALWMINDKCISRYEARNLNQGLSVQSGSNKGGGKRGSDGAYFADDLNDIYNVYKNDLTIKQRQVFDIEYGVNNIDGVYHNQIERAEHLNISVMAYKKRLHKCRVIFTNHFLN